VLAEIGLKDEVSLARENRSPSRREDYRSYYDETNKALVGNWYAREIKHFGYEF
jgi:hypothetical protein